MAYIIANKILLYHTPKTGGTFIFDFLKEYIRELGDNHDTPEMIDGKGYYQIAFVREPISWWESYWNWKNKDWDNPEGRYLNYQPTMHFFNYKSNNIHSFIQKVYRNEPHFLTNMFRDYTKQVNKVYRYEHIYKAILNICKYCQLDFTMKEIKKYHRVNPGHLHTKITGKKTLELIKEQEIEIYQKYY